MAQSGDSVQVRQEKCIGCKSCMVACPFGVMQVVVTPQAADLVKASAHKCDLCQGPRGGAGLCGKLSRAGADSRRR
ncbi:4Fe-4S binding protein [Klebsiella pneumoniae]|nr:4Fe-4S binding protein [Klebsiella pneumoniae]